MTDIITMFMFSYIFTVIFGFVGLLLIRSAFGVVVFQVLFFAILMFFFRDLFGITEGMNVLYMYLTSFFGYVISASAGFKWGNIVGMFLVQFFVAMFMLAVFPWAFGVV